MIWAIAIVAVIAVAFLLVNRPSRVVVGLSSAAYNAMVKKDWAMAVKILTVAREKAGKLKEPLRATTTAVVDLQMGTVLYRQGEFERAEVLLREGLVRAREALVTGADVVMHGDVTWGDLCTDAGRHGEAEHHYRRVFAVDEQRGNIGGAIFDLQRVADCLIQQDRRVEALCEIRRMMDMEASIVKGNPISMCRPDFHFCREEYEEARKLYREKVEFWQTQAAVPEQIDLGRLQLRLAISEARTGHAAEANEMLARAEATYGKTLGDGHPRLTAMRTYLTDSLLKAG